MDSGRSRRSGQHGLIATCWGLLKQPDKHKSVKARTVKLREYYSTDLGKAYLGDALLVMSDLPPASVNLIVTSPPFPLTFRKKKPYTSVGEDEFVGWFLPYAEECRRLLTPDGSLVIDLGGVWNKGSATKPLYQHRLILALCDRLRILGYQRPQRSPVDRSRICFR